MREHLLPVVTFLAIILCLGVLGYTYFAPEAEKYLKNQIPSIAIRDVGINATLADSEQERVRGLSGVQRMGPQDGLLLVFDEADHHAIWMKDMLFPIDIVWIGDDLTIVDISEALTPGSYPSIFEPRAPARMALELNARFVATYRLRIGDKVLMNDAYIPEDLKKK
jgi:uncharacterized membrane protein (UPF0127 family)